MESQRSFTIFRTNDRRNQLHEITKLQSEIPGSITPRKDTKTARLPDCMART